MSSLHVIDFALRLCSIAVQVRHLTSTLFLLVPLQAIGTLLSAYITFHDADVLLLLHRVSLRQPCLRILWQISAGLLFFVVFGCLQLIQVKRAWARQLHVAEILVGMDMTQDCRPVTASSMPAYAFAGGERILPVALLTGVPYLLLNTYAFMKMSWVWENRSEAIVLLATNAAALSTVTLGIREIDFAVSSYVVKFSHAHTSVRRFCLEHLHWLYPPCHFLFRAAEVSLRVLVVTTYFVCAIELFGSTCWAVIGAFGLFVILDYGVCVMLLRYYAPREEPLSAHLFVAVMLLVSDLAHFVDQPSYAVPARSISRTLFCYRLFGNIFVVGFSYLQRRGFALGAGVTPRGWDFEAIALAASAAIYYFVACLPVIHNVGEDLHTAARAGNADRIERLLAPNSSGQVLDVNARTKDASQVTPAMLAALRGHVRVLERLASAGAELNARSANGSSCLHLAVQRSQVE
eukprot:CAMPEP_0115236684 /NCGR_PEP_ID=MMETSP0270-20121206/35974_1 /TAXON_ID=71861 /ORGANISM="Scrippsiella trochoidea, Strain CCMP3099" /LENGTH=461 /DNA_ID=CAMNT_0002651547 /DNA_START=40 /DNA_END=1422 /DNA_ORIENTATION=-